MQNLKDQLLKMGLVTEEQVKKVDQPKVVERLPAPVKFEPRPKPPLARAFAPRVADPKPAFRPVSAPVPKFAPLAGSKQAQRLDAKKQHAQDKKTRETILAAQVPVESGDVPFYFVTRKNKLRRMELSAAQAQQLTDGVLAVVERPDPGSIEHALVPAELARELAKLSEKAVRFLNQADGKVGFLTEEEISKRQEELKEQTAPAISNGSGSVHQQPAKVVTEEAWVTIKRAPIDYDG